MSYILGALRKAEQERKGADEGDIEDWNSEAWNTPARQKKTSFWLTMGLATVVALLVAILIMLWVLLRSGSATPEPSARENITEESSSIVQSDINHSSPEETDDGLTEHMALHEAQNTQSSADSVAQPAKVGAPSVPKITGHLYFPGDQNLSRIFTQSGSYKIGHVFVDGLRLEAMSETKAVFDWHGDSIEVPFSQ